MLLMDPERRGRRLVAVVGPAAEAVRNAVGALLNKRRSTSGGQGGGGDEEHLVFLL